MAVISFQSYAGFRSTTILRTLNILRADAVTGPRMGKSHLDARRASGRPVEFRVDFPGLGQSWADGQRYIVAAVRRAGWPMGLDAIA
jgi:hypothetical protein